MENANVGIQVGVSVNPTETQVSEITGGRNSWFSADRYLELPVPDYSENHIAYGRTSNPYDQNTRDTWHDQNVGPIGTNVLSVIYSEHNVEYTKDNVKYECAEEIATLREENQKLQEEYDALKLKFNELYYAPGNPGYLEAQNSFESQRTK